MKKYELNKSKVPAGVKAISILYILGAVLMAVIGILMIAGSAAVAPFLAVYAPSVSNLDIGIFPILAAIFGAIVGFGLWTGKAWARMTALVLSGIALVLTLISILGGGNTSAPAYVGWVVNLTSLVIHGVIIWYLGFNKRAVASFN